MMAFEPINEEIYDDFATFITYAKVFPYILDHFVTRKDAKQMMLASNLSVNTSVNVNPGIGVTVASLTGVGSTVSPGLGTGTGVVNASYTGDSPHPTSKIIEQQVKAKKEAGGSSIEGLTSAFGAAAGE